MNNDLEQFSEERLKEISELTGAYEEWSASQDEIHALARIALSVKQAKPIGWMDTCELFDLQHGYTSKILPKKEMNNDIPLYTTTPPPHTEQGNQVEVLQFIINNPEKDGYFEWADCNQDYFNSTPKDHRRVLYTTPQPAHTEPDGWIKCSERMPQNNEQVLTWNGQYKATDLFLAGCFLCNKPKLITHWMPLPAAPKPESE